MDDVTVRYGIGDAFARSGECRDGSGGETGGQTNMTLLDDRPGQVPRRSVSFFGDATEIVECLLATITPAVAASVATTLSAEVTGLYRRVLEDRPRASRTALPARELLAGADPRSADATERDSAALARLERAWAARCAAEAGQTATASADGSLEMVS